MAVEWEKQWVQYGATFILLIGLFIALLSKNILVGVFVMFLSGLVAGRVWFLKRYKEQIFPFTMIIAGFIVGMLLGSMWSSRIFNVLLFSLGCYIGYILHKKGYITFKNQLFVK